MNQVTPTCYNANYPVFDIKVKYRNGEETIVRIKTDNLEWSMDEYQRNRDIEHWEIIKKQ